VAPPFNGVAEKTTLVPEHIAVEEAAITMDGVTGAVTFIVTWLDNADVLVMQVALLFSTHEITSPFARPAVE
jgi:hypothetical protein